MNVLAPETIKLGDEFYEQLQAGNFDSTYDFFSLGLFAEYSREDVKEMILLINNERGNVVSYELLNTSFRKSMRNGIKRDVICNSYKVQYSSGYISKEQLMYGITLDMKKVEKIDAYKFKKYSDVEDFE